MVVCKLASFVVHGRWVSELELGSWHNDLVPDILSADGVDHFIVDNLDRSVGDNIEIEVGRVCDRLAADFECNAKRVQFRMKLTRDNFLKLNSGISVPVDGRVEAERKDMLVSWSHDTGRNNDSVRDIMLDTLLHRNDRHDTGGSNFKVDRGSGVEHPAQDVLIICDCHDRLDNEFAGASDFGPAVTEICVFPTDTGIDFVHTNAVLHLDGFTLLVVDPSVEVLDNAEAITAQCEIIGRGAGAAFTEIISRLTVVRGSRITVRDGHLSKRQTIKDGSTVVTDITEYGTFAVVECHAESPFLPGDEFGVLRCNGEADTLGLRDVQRLKVLSERFLQLTGVFLIRLRNKDVVILGGGEEIASERQSLNADDFLSYAVDDAGKVKGMGIMVEGGMFLLRIDRGKKEVALTLGGRLND